VNKGMVAFCMVCLLVVGSMTAGCASGPVLTVSAGDFHRHATPVYVDLQRKGLDATTVACVESDGHVAPAQIEPLDDGRGRLWWILSDLPAGQTRTYTVKFCSACGDCRLPVFAWKDSSEGKIKSMDLMYGDRAVLRYMYTPYDGSSEEGIELSKKPFHHVFDPDGSQLITKGLGGKYPHHRGLFFAYNRIDTEGGPYDIWGGSHGDYQEHVKVVREMAGPVMGGHVVEIKWVNRHGVTLGVEKRRVVVFRSPTDEMLIEFTTTLEEGDKPVGMYSSNSHHGGVQFRAAQYVAEHEKETRYLRPAAWSHLPTDEQINTDKKKGGYVHKDLPWNALQYKLGDRAYTVAYLTDPANPGDADFSERLYGRFGEYMPWDLRADHPLNLGYRWWITANKDTSREDVQLKYEDYAHPPTVTVD